MDRMPRLRHCTLAEDTESGITKLVIGDECFDLAREGNRSDFLKLKSLLDGRHTLDEICDLTGLNRGAVFSAVEEFEKFGFFQCRNSQPEISKKEFLELVRSTTTMWRRQIGLHPLFGQLSEQSCRKEVFLGYLIESFHYMRELPRLIARLSASVADERIGKLALQYAEEEKEHYQDCLESLSKIERIGPHIEGSHPAPGTLSLLSTIDYRGRTSDLALACCIQFIEANTDEAEDAESHLLALAEAYGEPHLVAPFISHMKADLDAQHSSFLELATLSAETIEVREAHNSVNVLHDIKHAFDLFHSSILEYYEDTSNYIPRLTVDYFSL